MPHDVAISTRRRRYEKGRYYAIPLLRGFAIWHRHEKHELDITS